MTSSVQVLVFLMGLVFLTSHWVGGKEFKWDVGVPWGGLTVEVHCLLEKRGSYGAVPFLPVSRERVPALQPVHLTSRCLPPKPAE